MQAVMAMQQQRVPAASGTTKRAQRRGDALRLVDPLLLATGGVGLAAALAGAPLAALCLLGASVLLSLA